MMVAGEASGDVAGGQLLQELKAAQPGLRAVGVGGRYMREAGLEALDDISHLAVIGFVEVAGAAVRLRRLSRRLVEHMRSEKPAALVLIDYPGFNLRLAKRARALGVRVVYYISPQVWAWGANRIPLIARLVDRMIVVFPFEKELYEKTGLDVDFVGHPLLDRLPAVNDRGAARAELGISGEGPVIGLLPGSRKREVRTHLPVMLRAARLVVEKRPDCAFVLPCADPLSRELFDSELQRLGEGLQVSVVRGKTHEAIIASDMVLVASGTATLECACLERPMLIIYRVSLLTWLFVKPLIRLPYIGLVNIVAGRRIVPEFLQFDARPGEIAGRALEMLGDAWERELTVGALREVRRALGEPGASRRAARAVLSAMGGDDDG